MQYIILEPRTLEHIQLYVYIMYVRELMIMQVNVWSH